MAARGRRTSPQCHQVGRVVGCPIRSPWCGVQSRTNRNEERGNSHWPGQRSSRRRVWATFPVVASWNWGVITNLSVFLGSFPIIWPVSLSVSLCVYLSLTHTLLVGFFSTLSGICRKEFITLSPQILCSFAFSLQCSVSSCAVYILSLGVLAVSRRKRGGVSHFLWD